MDNEQTENASVATDSAPPAGSVPDCPKCGNNRQVWLNQITGKVTCHRAFCHTEIKPNANCEPQGSGKDNV